MGQAKKDRKREKTKPDPVDDDDDDDSEEEEEQEEVESAYAKRKKEKSRKAFMKLCRQLLAFIPMLMILSQQPLMYKERQSGVNAAKLVPMQLAVSGAIKWAKTSPTTLRNPQLNVHLNTTARVLLTPGEYAEHNFGRKSQRAVNKEKTWAAAWKKTERSLNRVVEGDAAMKAIVSAPFPNVPVIGSYLLVAASVLALLIPGLEYVVVVGCGMVMQGARGFGMEPQPELYVTGVCAVIGILCMDASNKKTETTKAKRR